MRLSEYAARNRSFWDALAARYRGKHASQLQPDELAWLIWSIPESQLQILGDVAGKDILELGCGIAQWSTGLARLGARPTALDNSARMLDQARALMAKHGVAFPLVHASAEEVPLPDESFDIVFSDHGGMSFGDPYSTVPEAARLLHPGGLLAFNTASPVTYLCWDDDQDRVTEELRRTYFGMHRFEKSYGLVSYQLPYGEWIRLFRRNGLVVEDLVEIRPPEGASTTWEDFMPLAWARRWPCENIWKVRKEG